MIEFIVNHSSGKRMEISVCEHVRAEQWCAELFRPLVLAGAATYKSRCQFLGVVSTGVKPSRGPGSFAVLPICGFPQPSAPGTLLGFSSSDGCDCHSLLPGPLGAAPTDSDPVGICRLSSQGLSGRKFILRAGSPGAAPKDRGR